MSDLNEICRNNGLRKTRALQLIYEALERAKLPISLADLEADPALSQACDRTTIFRTLQRLESVGVLRRLNFAERGARFTLKTGKSHNEYIICRLCGHVEPLPMACPVHALEKQVAETSQFADLSHELTFYGNCRECSEKEPS